jgi:hypothetical protein
MLSHVAALHGRAPMPPLRIPRCRLLVRIAVENVGALISRILLLCATGGAAMRCPDVPHTACTRACNSSNGHGPRYPRLRTACILAMLHVPFLHAVARVVLFILQCQLPRMHCRRLSLRPAFSAMYTQLHAIEAPCDLLDAGVLHPVVVAFRATPCGDRIGQQELERVAHHRRGLERVHCPVAHAPENLDERVATSATAARHCRICMWSPREMMK